MRPQLVLAIALGAVVFFGYAIGLGVYAVASTKGAVPSQPATAEEAAAVLEALELTEAYPFQSRFAQMPHGRMHYVDEGQGAPVLAVHGNPTWSFLYREFVKGLRDRGRVVVPDLIGFGLSEKLTEPDDYSIENHVDDVSALVESLDLRNVTLVMQDWGGPIGLGVAARHPDRIRALVVMNTFPFDGEEIRLPAFLHLLRLPVAGEQIAQGLGIVNRAPAIGHSDEVKRAYRGVQGSWQERAGTMAFPRLIPVEPDHPGRVLFREIDRYLDGFRGPVQIIWGMQDAVFVPEVLDVWRQRFPNADVLELENARHFLQEDAPERIVPQIAAFLARSVR